MQVEAGVTYAVTVEATAIAPYVWLAAEGIDGWFDDNSFTMLEASKTVHFQVWQPVFPVRKENTNVTSQKFTLFLQAPSQNVTLAKMRRALSVTTLADVYSPAG